MKGFCRRRCGFILLEVLVSIAILGLALAMVLRSFTNSMKATRQSRQLTTATLLARGLIEQWEIKPPELGFSRGDFGNTRPDFYYEVTYQTETLDYPDVTLIQDESRLAYLRTISLSIFCWTDRAKRGRSRVLRVVTALSSSERHSRDSRVDNHIGYYD